MGIFNKKRKDEDVPEVPSTDKIEFIEINRADDVYLTDLASKLIKDIPLVINFHLLDIDSANKAIAFLSGVVFATTGEIIMVKEKVFLFANKNAFDDGSLKPFVEGLE